MIDWDRIVHSAALDNHISDDEARKILNSSFRFMVHTAFKEKKSMRFKGWGIFTPAIKDGRARFRKKVVEDDRLETDSGGVLQLAE